MDNVLSLQMLASVESGDACANSSVSCPSNVSCQSHQSSNGSTVATGGEIAW